MASFTLRDLRQRLATATFFVGLITAPMTGFGQEAKADKRPVIVCAAPLVVVPGRETKLVLRGAFLDELTSIKITQQNSAKVEIVSKSKTSVPQNYEAKRVGDTLAEIKLTLPPESAEGNLSLTAESPNGVSDPYDIVGIAPDHLIEDKEPNDGFKSAQIVGIGKTISGTIADARNVDVFRIDLPTGQKLRVEAIAARSGSILDPTLTLYGSKGETLASSDDRTGTRDSLIETTLLQPGSYFIALQDANDSGGQHFVYLLKVTQ